MILNRVKLGRAVTFIEYFTIEVPLIFPPKTLILNTMTFPNSNSLNFPEVAIN